MNAVPVLETIPPLHLGDAWGKNGKEFLAAARELLFARHRAGASGEAIVREWTAVIDHLVRSLYEAARASYAERFTMLDQRVAVVAQGGYGRGELNPGSDIDLLFVYPQRADAFVETVTEKVLYALWDTGLTVGQAVRSVRDCVKLGGNLVSLGDRRVLSMAHNVNVNARLRDEGFEVVAVDYDMFALGGGGVHCSCHELRRDPD